jgi:hypothetical protein
MEVNYTKLSTSVGVPCRVDQMSVEQNIAYRMLTEGEG